MKFILSIYFQIYSWCMCFGNPNPSVHETKTDIERHGLHDEIQKTGISEESWRPWVSEIFSEAERKFIIHSEASTNCKHDFNLYQLHLKNHSLWAIRMSESSEWPKVGILVGMKPSLGHFDECVMINAHNIKGQHCLVESKISFSEFQFVTAQNPLDAPPEESSAWLALQMYENDDLRIQRNLFKWTLCVPSTCSELDLSKSLTRTLSNVFEKFSINITANVKEGQCHIQEKKYSLQYYEVMYFICSLLSLVIVSSIFTQLYKWNNTKDQPSFYTSVMKCFSFQDNYSALVEVTPARELMLVHIYRIIGTVITLMVHRFVFSVPYSHYDANFIEKAARAPRYTHLFNSFEVTLFFFLGGVSLYNSFMRSEHNWSDLPEKIIRRWLRLFSPYLIVRLFYTYILPSISGGPLWHELQKEAAYCRTNWLRALLTLPSGRDADMCYPTTWAVPIEFQLFILGQVYLTFCKYFRINVTKVSLSLMVISFIMTFDSIFSNQYYGSHLTMIVRPFNVERDGNNHVITHFHIYGSVKPRISSYVLGVLIALAADKLKKSGYWISRVQLICGLVIAQCLSSAAGASSYALYQQYTRKEYNREWHALHGTFYPILIVLPSVYLFFVYFVNGFEYLEKRIPQVVVPLGRLSYTVLVSHMIIIHFHVFSRRTITLDMDQCAFLYHFVADFVLTYVFALIIHLVVEAPVQRLYALIVSYTRKSRTRQHSGKDDMSMKKE